MKFKFLGKIVASGFILAFALLSFACQPDSSQATENVSAQSPREAYKLLYEAVKSKNPERVKQMMSENSITFAGIAAQQQNQSIDKVLENGFTATTFADSLPDSRDQRVNGNFGAVEVFNSKDNRWEDLPFILENGGWKLAVGDSFNGNYKLPSKGQAQLEMEAQNPGMVGNMNETTSEPRSNTAKGKKDEVKSVEVPVENANTTPGAKNKK